MSIRDYVENLLPDIAWERRNEVEINRRGVPRNRSEIQSLDLKEIDEDFKQNESVVDLLENTGGGRKISNRTNIPWKNREDERVKGLSEKVLEGFCNSRYSAELELWCSKEELDRLSDDINRVDGELGCSELFGYLAAESELSPSHMDPESQRDELPEIGYTFTVDTGGRNGDYSVSGKVPEHNNLYGDALREIGQNLGEYSVQEELISSTYT